MTMALISDLTLVRTPAKTLVLISAMILVQASTLTLLRIQC